MATCPKCKAENRPEAAFCANCGAILLVQPVPRKTTPEESPRLPTEPASNPANGDRMAAAPSIVTPRATERVERAPAPVAPQTPAGHPQPVPQFASQPEKTILADRYKINALVYLSEHENHYSASELCQPGSPCTRICSNPACRTVHSPAGADQEKFCTQCGSALEAEPPLLMLLEADRDRFSDQQPVIDLSLAHPNVHPPLATFHEEAPGGSRYYLAIPYAQELPAHPEKLQLLQWGHQLALGLEYLHSRGLVLGEELDSSSFGLAGERVVWHNFRGAHILPVMTDRERINDVRLLALSLYAWMTDKASYSADPSLSPAMNELFQRALVGDGFSGGAELAEQITAVIKVGIAPPNLDYQLGKRTHPGQIRPKNEDSLLCASLTRMQRDLCQPAGLFAIADGMGGHATGERASSLAIQALTHKVYSEMISLDQLAADDNQGWLKDAVQQANHAIYEARQQEGNDMGSTIACALLLGSQATIAHIGDSRVYLIRGGSIQQLTNDHSLVQHLVEIGQINPEDTRNHPQRNVIYRSLGDKPQVEADIYLQKLLEGDRVLLCSDGLSGVLEDEALLKIIQEASSPQSACDKLVEAANQAGGEDNISVILVEVIRM